MKKGVQACSKNLFKPRKIFCFLFNGVNTILKYELRAESLCKRFLLGIALFQHVVSQNSEVYTLEQSLQYIGSLYCHSAEKWHVINAEVAEAQRHRGTEAQRHRGTEDAEKNTEKLCAFATSVLNTR